jgi:hypothetical protein
MTFSVMKVNRCCGVWCHFHLQEINIKQVTETLRWKSHVSPKCLFTFNRLQSYNPEYITLNITVRTPNSFFLFVNHWNVGLWYTLSIYRYFMRWEVSKVLHGKPHVLVTFGGLQQTGIRGRLGGVCWRAAGTAAESHATVTHEVKSMTRNFLHLTVSDGPPVWSSGQSS